MAIWAAIMAPTSNPTKKEKAEMMRITNGTHVVIADSEKALYLVNRTDGEDPHLQVAKQEQQDNPATRDQAANRRGHMAPGVGPKSAFDDTDWHELQKERFAEDIADHLYEMAHSGEIERLILVAGPKVLGNIRDALHVTVREKIVAEVDKNLAGHPLHEIEKILKVTLAEN